MLFRKGWGALVNLGVMAYLARTLDKEDFGLVAISGTLISFIQVFGLSGIGEYVVFYNGEERKSILNSAFWLNFWISLAIVGITLLAMPFWAKWYNDPRIVQLVILLLVGFFFTSLSSIPISIFRKELNYGPMIAIQTLFGTISQLLNVLFAVLGFGVFSLALPSAIIPPLLCAAYFWKTGFKPNFLAHGREYWNKIFSYTKHVIGSRILGKVANEGDTLIIGKLLGMEALGIYDIAFKLANMFNSQLLPIITNISLPVFAQNQQNKSKLKVHYLLMIEIVSFIVFPLSAAMILFAHTIIISLYGATWEAAILPFQILCMFTLFRSLSSPTSGLFNSLGKPQIGLYIMLVFIPIFIISISAASAYGLIASCIAVMFSRQFGSCINLYVGGTLVNVKISELFKTIKAPLISSLFSFVMITTIYNIVQYSLLLMFLFVIVYFVFIWFMYKKEVVLMIGILRQAWPNKY